MRFNRSTSILNDAIILEVLEKSRVGEICDQKIPMIMAAEAVQIKIDAISTPRCSLQHRQLVTGLEVTQPIRTPAAMVNKMIQKIAELFAISKSVQHF